MSSTEQPPRVVVWDPFVRFGHWALLAAFAIAYLSAEEETNSVDLLHIWGGYAVGIIVVLRVAWGFVGPRHARFSDFVYGPTRTVGYLAELVRGGGRRYLGHSPAGGAMVIALLLCLAGAVGTGLVAYGEGGKGPLSNSSGTVSAALDDKKDNRSAGSQQARLGEERESVIGELHGALANLTLFLVVLHVVGVGLASVVHRENLVLSMFTGEKRSEE